jgi:hypothetical protein
MNKIAIVEYIFGTIFLVVVYYFSKEIHKDIFKK